MGAIGGGTSHARAVVAKGQLVHAKVTEGEEGRGGVIFFRMERGIERSAQKCVYVMLADGEKIEKGGRDGEGGREGGGRD